MKPTTPARDTRDDFKRDRGNVTLAYMVVVWFLGMYVGWVAAQQSGLSWSRAAVERASTAVRDAEIDLNLAYREGVEEAYRLQDMERQMLATGSDRACFTDRRERVSCCWSIGW